MHVGGSALVDAELQDISESDLKRAESVVLPGTLILLVLVFGSVVAAALPLLIGVLAIAGTLLVLSVLGSVTDVSVFALNLTTALGLGLGIDYGLLVVSRFREELAAGFLPRTAAVRTVRTAGHTIAFSAATVSAALATLLVFPPYFLRSFAYAGIAVVAIAAVSAVTVLPALLALLGKRVNAWAVPWRRTVRSGSRSRFWEGLARIVVRRPLIAALPVIGLLTLLAAPFAHADFATPDDRALPVGAAARQTGDLVRDRFDMKGASALTVVTTRAVPRVSGRSTPAACPRSRRSPRSWDPTAATGTASGPPRRPPARPSPARPERASGPPGPSRARCGSPWYRWSTPSRTPPSGSSTTSARSPTRRAPRSSSADRAPSWSTPRPPWVTGSPSRSR